MQKQEELEDLKDGAQVRLMLWLGLEKDQEMWTEHVPGGDLATFAETVCCCCFGELFILCNVYSMKMRPVYLDTGGLRA